MRTTLAMTTLSCLCWMTGCSQQTTEQMGEAVQSAEQSVSDAASDASQTASDAMDSAGQAAADAADTAKQTAGETVEAAKVVADDAAAAAGEAKDKLAEGMAGLVDQARTALEGVEGGPAMLQSVTEYFEKAREALSGITDKASAEAAVAKLGDLGGSLDGVSEKVQALPDAAKTALHNVIEKGRENLHALAEKYKDNPTVKDVIQPKIDEIMKRLSDLTGKE